MGEVELTTGWWRRLLTSPEILDVNGVDVAGAGVDSRYLWLLPGDAALAAPPAVPRDVPRSRR